MSPAEETNPYAAPTAPIRERRRGDRVPLASLGERFAGAVVDSIFHFIFIFIGALLVGGLGVLTGDQEPTGDLAGALAFFALVFVPVLIQWGLLWTRSQSLGKIVMKTRIHVADGEDPAGPGRTIGLRYIPIAIAQFLLPFIGLIDALLIFAGDRRQCLHDKIAGTVVRKVR